MQPVCKYSKLKNYTSKLKHDTSKHNNETNTQTHTQKNICKEKNAAKEKSCNHIKYRAAKVEASCKRKTWCKYIISTQKPMQRKLFQVIKINAS